MDTKKFIKRDLDPKDFVHTSAKRARRFWVVVHTDEGGYIENDFTVHIWDNGDFTISDNDGEGFVSLHGDIATEIRAYLSLPDNGQQKG